MSGGEALDLVTFEVLRHRLWEINDEMATLASRLSGTPTVYDTGDFNTAILTAAGKGLYTGVYVIRQASALDLVVRAVIEGFEGAIRDGDMFLTNDPWCGALHAMDYAVVAPVFWGDELVCWTGVVMHEIDVGGPRPGSWTVGARDAFQECPLLPPIKIVEDGRLRNDVEALYLRNTRTPGINALNLRAKIAAQTSARERLRELIRDYGRDAFVALQERLLDYVRATVRARIATAPDGDWSAVGLLDHDGVEDRLFRLKLKLAKRGSHLLFDFTGTSKQAAGSVNCAYSGLIGAITQVLLPFLCFDLPWSHGAIADCFDVVSEEGSINNCRFPAATSMATVSACQSTANVVWEAVARMMSCSPELRPEAGALCYGGVNLGIWSGLRPDRRPFVNLFTDSVGGGGALADRDGVDTCGNLASPSYGIPNVERIEGQIPALYVYRKERRDTGGAGRRRGGLGIEYMIVPHGVPDEQPIDAVFISSGVSHSETKGLAGGLPGAVQGHLVLREARVMDLFRAGIVPTEASAVPAERRELAAAKDVTRIGPRDAWVCACSGGGGYGDPLEREAERVARDVRLGHCSPEAAQRLYGVVASAAGELDREGSAALRGRLRRARAQSGRALQRPPAGAAPFEGPDVIRYGDLLAVRETGSGAVLVCVECGCVLGPSSEDPRERALLHERPLADICPSDSVARGGEVVIREYACPSCAGLFSTDVQLRSDDPRSPEMTLLAPPRVAGGS